MSARCPLDFDRVRDIVLELAAMPFFPAVGEDAARLAIVKIAAQIADSEREVRIAVRQILRMYDQWPGPRPFIRALNEACKHEPSFGSNSGIWGPTGYAGLPYPDWFLAWSDPDRQLALPAPDDAETLAIEASPDSLRALTPSKELVRRRPAPVHVMPTPVVKPVPSPLTEAEIQQRELIRAEVERLMNERKKGTA